MKYFQSKHHKMSNENYKHHENRGKVEGGLTCTFQGTLFLILLCKVAGDFENHFCLRNWLEKLCSLNPTDKCFFFPRKAKKYIFVKI